MWAVYSCARPAPLRPALPHPTPPPNTPGAFSCLQLYSVPAFQLLFSENTRQQPSGPLFQHLTQLPSNLLLAGLQGP